MSELSNAPDLFFTFVEFRDAERVVAALSRSYTRVGHFFGSARPSFKRRRSAQISPFFAASLRNMKSLFSFRAGPIFWALYLSIRLPAVAKDVMALWLIRLGFPPLLPHPPLPK